MCVTEYIASLGLSLVSQLINDNGFRVRLFRQRVLNGLENVEVYRTVLFHLLIAVILTVLYLCFVLQMTVVIFVLCSNNLGFCNSKKWLADRTNGRAYATVFRPSVCRLCEVMYCG